MEGKDYSDLKQALAALKKGYETGDFSELFPYLSEDCMFNTLWRRTPVIGKNAVTAYFTHKGESIAKTGTFPVCQYVIQKDDTGIRTHTVCGWEGKIVPTKSFRICHEKGKYALLMTQTLNGEANTVFVDMDLNGMGKVSRILLLEKLFFDCEEAKTAVLGAITGE